MEKLLYKVIFLLSVPLLLIAGNSCKKVEWPTVPESSVNKPDTNTGLNNVAIYNVVIAANSTPQTVTRPFTNETVTTTYSYSVSFAIYAKGDVNYTTPLYSDTISGIPYPPESPSNSNPTQYVFPVHYNINTNGCIERSKFTVTKVATIVTVQKKMVGGNWTYPKTTTYTHTPVGGQVNVSNTCQGFTSGIVNSTNYMIFNQTGTAVID